MTHLLPLEVNNNQKLKVQNFFSLSSVPEYVILAVQSGSEIRKRGWKFTTSFLSKSRSYNYKFSQTA